jgi:hypothetical protein
MARLSRHAEPAHHRALLMNPTSHPTTMNDRHQTQHHASKQFTPGHKSILVTDAAYSHLKAIQFCDACERMPVRFYLKDIATAFIEEAMVIPGFPERVLKRASVMSPLY